MPTAGTSPAAASTSPDWADLNDVRPGSIIENPDRQPIGIDPFAGAGGFSCGFKQTGWHVIAANDNDVDAAHTYLYNLGSPDTRIVSCTPEDKQRWTKRRNPLERYHAQPDRPPLEPGSGWIAGQTGVQPCEVLFFGDVRARSPASGSSPSSASKATRSGACSAARHARVLQGGPPPGRRSAQRAGARAQPSQLSLFPTTLDPGDCAHHERPV